MADEEIIPLLQHLRRPTLFTRDEDFYERHLRHAKYSLVYLSVERNEAAVFIRRLLRQAEFRTQAMRMGKVIRVSHAGISCWQQHRERETHFAWK